jgi:prepilin-type N-terminal cleavage/methylation domain-containing protein
MKLKKKKGFTLIELLIVVAIIAILAAIAIPQFSQYRIRGYNSAAASDLRNTKIALEAFKTDWQAYFSTSACTDAKGTACDGKPNTGNVVVGPGTLSFTVAAGAIGTNIPSTDTVVQFGLSSGVGMSISTDATAVSYTIADSHSSGDVIYGADSDITSVKQAGKLSDGTAAALTAKVPGHALAAGMAATSGPDDFSDTAIWATM